MQIKRLIEYPVFLSRAQGLHRRIDKLYHRPTATVVDSGSSDRNQLDQGLRSLLRAIIQKKASSLPKNIEEGLKEKLESSFKSPTWSARVASGDVESLIFDFELNSKLKILDAPKRSENKAFNDFTFVVEDESLTFVDVMKLNKEMAEQQQKSELEKKLEAFSLVNKGGKLQISNLIGSMFRKKDMARSKAYVLVEEYKVELSAGLRLGVAGSEESEEINEHYLRVEKEISAGETPSMIKASPFTIIDFDDIMSGNPHYRYASVFSQQAAN